MALIAGGPHDVYLEIRQYLATHREMFAKYHRDYHKPRLFGLPIPSEVDLVLILTDMLGHGNESAVRAAVDSANRRAVAEGRPELRVMLCRSQRKKTHLCTHLSLMRFPARLSLPMEIIAKFAKGEEGTAEDNAVTDPTPIPLPSSPPRLVTSGETVTTTAIVRVEQKPAVVALPEPPAAPGPPPPPIMPAAPIPEVAPMELMVLAQKTALAAAPGGWSVLITPQGIDITRGGIKK